MPEQSVLLKYKYWVLGAVCLLTFICFNYSLHNQFTNWDDDVYVTNDTVIQKLNAANLETIFTEDITKNNYHPFCMLSLGINYQFAKLAPATYYLTNILIHVANVALVFFLIMQLCKIIKLKENESFLISAFVALWFGVHPLHVESVSWIAERKDVLYTFFYLLGLLAYIRYISQFNIQNLKFKIQNKWIIITFILFICSCLSKPMAVVFPLSMLAIDYLAGRKIEMKLLTEKSLFFLAALFFGGYAYYTQNRTGAIADFSKLTIMERIMYASYGFDMYLYKLINPSFLSTFYPYPYRYIDGSLPGIYYAAPFIAVGIVALPLYIAYKFNRAYFKIIAFAYGFFIANVIFVLQFISCGAAIMADRYSYVSSIGIFFALAYFIYELIKHFPNIKTVTLTILLFLSGALAYGCYQRTKVWHNAETLYKDAIGKYPYRALLSYKWLGYYYLNEIKDTDKALENFEVLAKINAGDAKIYDVLGNIYRDRKNYKDAMTLYGRSLQAQNDVYITYVDRSLAYMQAGDSADARKDYAQALALNHEQAIQSYGKLASQNINMANSFNALGNITNGSGGPYMAYLDSSLDAANNGDSSKTIRYYLLAISKSPGAEKIYSEKSFAMVQAKQYLPVIEQYKALLLVNPNNAYYYFYKGVAEFGAGKLNASITDFKASLKFNVKEVSVVAAFNLATICDSVGDDKNALTYANMATQLGKAPTPEFVKKIKDKATRNGK